MLSFSGRVAALSAVLFSLAAAGAGAHATAPLTPTDCATAKVTVLHRVLPAVHRNATDTTYAVVRITLDRNGVIRSKRLVWNSNDAAFNTASMRAVDRTAFAPASLACVATTARFDYIFVSTPEAKRVSAAVVSKVGP